MNTCKHCNHKWQSRVKKPTACPKCKSYNWQKEKMKPGIPKGYQYKKG